MFYEFITTHGWWLLAVTCSFGAGMFYQILRQDSSILKTRQALREAKAHIAARDETIGLWRDSARQKETEAKMAKAEMELSLSETQEKLQEAEAGRGRLRETTQQLAAELQVMTAKFDAQLIEGNKLHDQVRMLQQDNCSMKGEHSELVESYNAMAGQLSAAPPGTYVDMIRYSIAEITRAREENETLKAKLRTAVTELDKKIDSQLAIRPTLRAIVSNLSTEIQRLDSITSSLE